MLRMCRIPTFRFSVRAFSPACRRHARRWPTALAGTLLTACVIGSAHASSGSRYIRLRRSSNCDPRVSLAQVQAEASRFTGRVIELRGTVGGRAETAGSISMMLSVDGMPDAPTLDVPLSEADVVRDGTPRVRVLARVGASSYGNVVALTVLAVAHDSEVTAEERKAENQMLLQSRRAELNAQARQRQLNGSVSSASMMPSRGSYVRSAPISNVPPAQDYSQGLGPRVRDWYGAYYSFILNHNHRLGANMAGQIAFYLLKFSDEHNVDPRLVTAMIVAESDFDPQSTSHAGAMGLGQLMPDEIRSLGLNNGYDIRQNLYGSIANLRTDLNSFAGMGSADGTLSIDQIRLAMATYNAGLGAVKKYKGVPPYRETQGYVKRVVRLYRQFCGLPPQ